MLKSKRNYNLDALKVYAMICVIIVHLIGKGGLINSNGIAGFTLNSYIFLKVICLSSINLFGITTGYLYIKKDKINYKNIVGLVFVCLFYSLIISLAFYGLNLFSIKQYGIKYLLNSIFPMRIGRYWFITCYFFLFFTIPYMNRLLNKLRKEEYQKIIIIVFLLASVVTEIGGYDFFGFKKGYSPFWLMYLYLLGAYINLYGFEITHKKAFIYVAILLILDSIIVSFCLQNLKTTSSYYNFGNNYNSILIVLSSILIFSIFINSHFKSNIIYQLSKVSFSVYIIHSHRLIYDYVINNNMLFLNKYNIVASIVLVIIISIGVYLLCSIIDFLRIKLFKLFKLDSVINKIGYKLNEVLL